MEELHRRFTAGSLLSFPATVTILAAVMDGDIPCRPSLPLCAAPSCAAQRVMRPSRQWAQDQDVTLMHRLGFTRRPPKDSRDPQSLDRSERPGIRAGFDPLGRDVVEPADTSSNPRRRRPSPWMASPPRELRWPSESRAPALLAGPRIGFDARANGCRPTAAKRRPDERERRRFGYSRISC